MKVLHNRQLQSSPFHSFVRFLKVEILGEGLMSLEIPCHSLHPRKEILSNPYRKEDRKEDSLEKLIIVRKNRRKKEARKATGIMAK